MKQNLEQYIVDMVKQSGKNGIVLGALGYKVHTKYKDFKLRDFGYSQFHQFVKKIDHIAIRGDGKFLKAYYKEKA